MDNCLDCPSHKVISDRDPEDWFCDDDEAVVCTQMKNPTQNLTSKWLSDHSEFRVVACSCRPYNKRKESSVPDWCPLSHKLNIKGK